MKHETYIRIIIALVNIIIGAYGSFFVYGQNVVSKSEMEKDVKIAVDTKTDSLFHCMQYLQTSVDTVKVQNAHILNNKFSLVVKPYYGAITR